MTIKMCTILQEYKSKRSQPKCIDRNHIDRIKQGALVSAPARKGFLSLRYDQRAARQVPDSNPGGPVRMAGRS